MTYTFTNEKLKALYEKLNSQEGFNLRYIKNISSVIYPLLEEVIHDCAAYSEAIFNWPEFQCVVDVVENSDKEFIALSEEESMCYSLWWNTNHSRFSDKNDPELEAIFKNSEASLEQAAEVENAYADNSILQQVHQQISNNTSIFSDNGADYLII